jgi:hypothetical protein
MNGEAYLYEIQKIDKELKRLNAHAKSLRSQRAKSMTGLHHYMVSHNLQQVGSGKNTITIKKCAPKEKRSSKLKPKSQRRAEALELLTNAGLPNPEQFYDDLERVQKATNTVSDDPGGGSSSKKKKNNRNDYDPLLGF